MRVCGGVCGNAAVRLPSLGFGFQGFGLGLRVFVALDSRAADDAAHGEGQIATSGHKRHTCDRMQASERQHTLILISTSLD